MGIFNSDTIFGLRWMCGILLFAGVHTISAAMTPPPNDHFANRSLLEGTEVDIWATNVNATIEPLEAWEADASSPDLAHTVWWTWTAPTNGLVVISVQDSSFEAYTRIYRGDSLSSLKQDFPDKNSGRQIQADVEMGRVSAEEYEALAIVPIILAFAPVKLVPIEVLRLIDQVHGNVGAGQLGPADFPVDVTRGNRDAQFLAGRLDRDASSVRGRRC